eukprot:Gb_20816 [translate_table: standard]
MEKDIRINYLFTRIVKLLAVELYCTHTAACIFYYLATTVPASKESFTWIGSLSLGDYNYDDFRDIGLARRYITSLYFAIVTMATVGYGDIHAVNVREMIFVMIFVSFDMILGAYLIGNMTALIVKGSKTERFRDKMTDVIKYMNRNQLEKDIRAQIKSHLRLQYESNYSEASVLQDIPVSIRAKISQLLYKSTVERVPLFKGCTGEFINQIVTKLQEEFFLPGEVIMEQGNAVDQIYFVSSGLLEEVLIGEDGSEETITQLRPNSLFGEISVLCKIPQPYSVRVCELCRLLRLEKQSFANILQLYFKDGRQMLNNLLEGKDTDLRIKQLEADITLLIAKQEAELALQVNSAAYYGDLYHLKSLIRAGADPSRTDYDGRTALHLAASKGYEEIVIFLLHSEAEIDSIDKFGNTPLLEAVKSGHDQIAALLVKKGASLDLEDAGRFLCKAVATGNVGFLKQLLAYGMDPNSKDYDNRTALHVAAAEGLHLFVKILLESGASVFSKDRWGNTPLDEGRKCGSNRLIQMLEEAKDGCLREQLPASERANGSLPLQSSNGNLEGNISIMDTTSISECAMDSHLPEGFSFQKLQMVGPETRKQMAKTCTVFPFHPWTSREKRRHGLVMWVPESIELLLQAAAQHFGFTGTCVLTEDAGQILHVDFIQDSQKLYLVDGDQWL